MSRFKLVFFVPVKHTSRVLNHIFSKMPNVVGKIGQYESCAFVTRGTGQFRPGPEANPTIGTRGELEFVEENRVEVVVDDKGANEEVRNVITELKSVRTHFSCIRTCTLDRAFTHVGASLRRSRIRCVPTRGFLACCNANKPLILS